MKRLLLSVILIGCLCHFSIKAQEEIATFGRNSFAGWTYENKAGIEITAQNIGLGKIVLYTISQDNVRRLISPYISWQQADSLIVTVSYRTIEEYRPDLVTVRVALCDDNSNEEAVAMMPVLEGGIDHELRTSLPAPAGQAMHKLHFTAPLADIDNNGAIMAVHVFTASNGTLAHGDVNGDGNVDIEDVNALINIILSLKSQSDFPGNANINGQGLIDIEDVNALINLIL